MRPASFLITTAAITVAAAALATPNQATLTVTATVLPRASATVLNVPGDVVVTPADIARGFVDVPTPIEVSVRNNSPAGYLLVFDGTGQFYTAVNVEGLAGPAVIGGESGWVRQPYSRGARLLRLRTRFLLGADAAPGAYPWPLTLSAEPL